MLLLFLIIPLSLAQNLYGPSQLDQYARLLNSGNLGGFGFFQHALTQGTLRGLGDFNTPPLIVGLPPLPLTHEEVMNQLTSTPRPPITRATAIPTTPSTNPGGIYAVNAMVELPPMPESRPKPPPLQREPEYNNLLAEIEEYDDFLEEERLYRSRYPQASLPNPYRNLPPGQLPSAGAYSVLVAHA
ncbi:unnamed protein product [Angiostrongylus costaricensis]|uniref:Ameloblastin n=1 Tax=Angiostrongylus costaricensis TaxID=334426 RepID=A0A0R3PZ83_ANGCS|nr:unnamed protein product [Angiostrongylus costaricensis]